MGNITGLLTQFAFLASSGGEDAAGEHAPGIADFSLKHWQWTWLIFFIVFLVLWRFAWRPLRDQLEARENRIRETVEKAHEVKAEAEMLLDKHREMMERAKADAQDVINEGREAGEKVRQEAAEAGVKEAHEFVERARKEIDLETKKALDEIRREAVDLSLLAAGKILERSIEDEDHRKLADQVVDELSAMKRPN